ncbi:hypothetical protein [Arenivirga flava]|uniref:Uncharacterized protein n=1 Tax=Arenivirga flava TaxID=1930060 RepID=A0AA37UFS0_9MICO|nr:hypothetical protein [Arenivirga flava]GMA29718.1 hypothetical protein GCM10025874_29710 [Arenivirga flava]
MSLSTWGPHRGEPWTSGRWRAELRGDELADLRVDGVLVARSVRAVVRDRDWGTVPVTVAAMTHQEGAAVLALRYDGLGITADATLRIEERGAELSVSLELTADGHVTTNRTGLVLLHPPVVSGAALRIRHADGSSERTVFPGTISPHQPAFGITGLDWPHGGLELSADFTGDVFEMEDQRNWTDASYKTYSRPLALPFPYELAEGGRVEQSIVFRATGSAADADAQASALRLVDAGRAVPSVLVGASTAPTDGTAHPTPAADAVLVEIEADAPNAAAVLARAAASGLPLDVRIVAADPSQVAGAVALAAPHAPVRLAVFDALTHVSEEPLHAALVEAAAGLDAELIGGARSHFTELNRTHERLPRFDAWTISITPQMHARETFQIEESIGLQRRVAADAVAIAGGAPLHVGPITLRPRFNAVATTAPPEPPADLHAGYGPALRDDATDERQAAPQLAAWVVASAAALAQGGAASVAWFEEWGPRGLDGMPAAEAVAAVRALSGLPLLVPEAPAPDDARTWALAARTPDGVRVLAARLGDTADELAIAADGRTVRAMLEPGTWSIIDVPADHEED